MKTNRALYLTVMLAAVMLFVATPCWRIPTAFAADHREAPVVDAFPEGDITDVYAFVSPEDPSKVVFIMNVNPFSVPAENPSYQLSPEFLYQFKVDNNGDAREDVVIQVAVEGTLAAKTGQTIRVFGPARPEHTGARNRRLKGDPAAKGVFGQTLTGANGLRAFVGLKDDPFTFDVSQFFRILNSSQDVFRAATSPVLGALRGRAVRADGTSGVDSFAGFNVTSIVVEVPKSLVQRGDNPHINVWATVSQRVDENEQEEGRHEGHVYQQFERMGQQVFATVFIPKDQRDAENAEIPEHDVANYSKFIPDTLTITDTDGTNNTIAGRVAVLNLVGVTSLPNGVSLVPLLTNLANRDRNLLRNVLLPDVLRLDLSILPDPNKTGQDLGVFSNGLQNGRRPGDSVVDIGLLGLRQLADVKFPDGAKVNGIPVPGSGPVGDRIALDCRALPGCPDRRVLVVLQGTTFNKPDALLGDLSQAGNDSLLPLTFPFLANPHPLP